MRVHLALLTFLSATALALPSSRLTTRDEDHVVHERRNALPQGWVKRDRLSPHFEIPVSIALKQQNLDRIQEYLEEVSHPDSKAFGQVSGREDPDSPRSDSSADCLALTRLTRSTGTPLESPLRSPPRKRPSQASRIGWPCMALDRRASHPPYLAVGSTYASLQQRLSDCCARRSTSTSTPTRALSP